MSPVAGRHASRPPGRPASATPEEVLAVASQRFRAGERLDVRSVALELNLSRASIYRWFGSREGLLGAVMAGEIEVLFDWADAGHRRRGAQRLLEVMDRVVRSLSSNEALRRYLENESTSALRVLTASSGQVQQRAVAVATQLISRVERQDGYQPPLERSTLAYTLIRLAEAFLYNDAAVGIKGDVDRLHDVVAALLGLNVRPREQD